MKTLKDAIALIMAQPPELHYPAYYADLLKEADVPDNNVGKLNKFIDGLEEIFADIRERHGDDSVCGLCEYDGAYIGQSGDWCNECPGFEKDDCFKLSDKCRKQWIDTITNSLPSAEPEPKWIPVSKRLPDVDVAGKIEVMRYDGQVECIDATYLISKPVVAKDKDGKPIIAIYEVDDDERKYWINDADGRITDGITEWMPIPYER